MDDIKTVLSQMDNRMTREESGTVAKLWPNTNLYTRMVPFQAGFTILGAEHKIWSLNILLSGRILVMTDPFGEYVELVGPMVFESGPGTQKLIKALTDCVFMEVIQQEEGDTLESALIRLVGEEK